MIKIMKILSVATMVFGMGVILYGLFIPAQSWLIGMGFVLTVAATVGSLGYFATDDLNEHSPKKNSVPPEPVALPRRLASSA